MTTIYFIRHAESDHSVKDPRTRPLTQRGWLSRAWVSDFLRDKHIDALLSSPYKRAVDTVAGFAQENGLDIALVEDFREQLSSGDMRRGHVDFHGVLRRQWEDFNYTFSDGETLAQVQRRNVAALTSVLKEYKDKNIAIGTHGTALSLIINHFDPTYGYDDFLDMEYKLPWAVKMVFEGQECRVIDKIDLYTPS